MSKQCYWSSGARRRDWSVNSLRCWRCLVINTPDETPSKAHPSSTGRLLLPARCLSLCISFPRVFCCWLLKHDCTVCTSFEFRLIFFFLLYICLLLLLVMCPLFDWLFFTYSLPSLSVAPSFLCLSLFFFSPNISVYILLHISRKGDCTNNYYLNLRKDKWKWLSLICINLLVNHMKIRRFQTQRIQFAETRGSLVILWSVVLFSGQTLSLLKVERAAK